MDKREARLLVPAEIPAEAKMNARKDTVCAVGAQIGTSRRQHRPICGKQPHQRMGQKLVIKKADGPPSHHNEQAISQGLPGPPRLSRSHILGRYRRDGR